MELWIRSQDKRTLINTKRIDVDDTNIIVWDKGRYASEIYLGQYKTKERALEVLDEIQKIIKWCQTDMENVTIGDIESLKGCFDDYIYEMPKE